MQRAMLLTSGHGGDELMTGLAGLSGLFHS